METVLEGVLTIKKDGELVAVVYNGPSNRSQVFYRCKEMGAEDIKGLLEDMIEKKAICLSTNDRDAALGIF
jgi:hypothetical protein